VQGDTVYIKLWVPNARTVFFSSSLDGYARHPAEKIGFGQWQVAAPAFQEFKYFYIVDDAVFIPDCRFREHDDFGSENCVYAPLRPFL
jgi:hypothetical protein